MCSAWLATIFGLVEPDPLGRRPELTCQLFLAVGTSLRVQPAARLCALALEAGARLIIVNADPTPYDNVAAAVLRGPIGEVLPAIVPGKG
jgi:NAD-dependent deacetylase